MLLKRIILYVYLLVISQPVWAHDHVNVFVLHSYSQDYPWTHYQHEGFVAGIKEGEMSSVQISSEYLDTKRRSYDAGYAAKFADHLEYKYSDYSPELIYVTDDNALTFALSHLVEIFPQAPIFFSGVNNYAVQAMLDPDMVSGVFEQKEILTNIQLLQAMDRDIMQIVVVGDASNTYAAIELDIKETLSEHTDIEAVFIAENNIEQLVHELGQRREDYVFLTTLGAMSNAEGKTLTLDQTISAISEAGDFVILSMEDAYLYNGVIGGFVTSGRKQGRAAARMVLSYLSGTAMRELVPVTRSPNEYIFDARELSKHDLTLPADIETRATILNKPRSFYERNRNLVLGIIFGLIVLIFVLMAIFLVIVTHGKAQIQRKSRRIEEQADKLHRVQDTLTSAQTIAHVGSWDWNIVTGELLWSDEIYRIFGLTPQQFGATYDAFLNTIHPDDRDSVIAAVEASIADPETPYSIEHRIVWPDGTLRCVHEQGRVYFDDESKAVRMIGAVHDITERKRAEEALRISRDELEERVKERTQELEQSMERVSREIEERKRTEESLILSREEALKAKEEAEYANQMKSVFLSRMSHELRTPMNAILGFSQLLDMQDMASKHIEHNREILKAARHLLTMIDEVLDLSALEAGRVQLSMADVDPQEVIAESITLVSPLAEDHKIQIEYKPVAQEVQYIRGDKTRVVEVLTNLITNAVKYNKQQGYVEIRIDDKRGDGKVRISVTDNGVGIADDKAIALFEPFNRLGAEYSDVEGTGVGLSIARQLMHLMGGDIGFSSKKDHGSTFWVDFIACERNQGGRQPEQQDATPDQVESRGAVLYVEDNPANMRFVQAVLDQYMNLDMLSAATGEDGIQIAREQRPDVILLDINLPGKDGYEVLAELQTIPETKSIPVIALSASAMPHDVERGLAAGFLQYLTKPIDVVDLINALNSSVVSRMRDSQQRSA